jgi:hypothetical protein
MFRSWIIFVLLFVAGCGGGKTAGGDPRKTDLDALYDLYRMYVKHHQKPPGKLADLTGKDYEPIYPNAVRGLRDGQYVVVWGTKPGKGGKAVLAYEKDAPKSGGVVLLANGTVTTLSADAVRAALKEKPG